MKTIFTLFVCTLFAPLLQAQTLNTDSLLKVASALEEGAQEEASLTDYLAVLKASPLNYEANWHTSFLYSKIGNRQTNPDTKKQDFVTAKLYAVKALKLNPSDAEANYVMAVAMGRMALLLGGQDKVDAANDIKRYVDLALKSNPNHAGAWHVLGKWHYEIATLSWVEKQAANMFLGGIDGTGSLAESVNCYKKAIALSPAYILYYLDLAITYVQQGDKPNAISTLQKALSLPVKTEDDPMYLKQCQLLLNNIQH